MKGRYYIPFSAALLSLALFFNAHGKKIQHEKMASFIDAKATKVKDRIKVPAGYTRINEPAGSFGEYLSNLKLKPDGALVHYFDGRIKENNGIYVAVVDMPIGDKDLQQCADVIMHVRAEYLYYHHQEDKIHFTLTNGFRADYSKWRDGYRIQVSGNKTSWVKTAPPGNSFGSFSQYMNIIYNYCGTLSLSRELKKVSYKDLKAGDVLIKGGTPGHAEIVLDVAQNKEGHKIYLLAQSYMPAQEMQVLANPDPNGLGPWYSLNLSEDRIATPQWDFTSNQLMRFEDN